MNLSMLLNCAVTNVADPSFDAKVADVVLRESLDEVVWLLLDVTTDDGVRPLFLGPEALAAGDEGLTIATAPDILADQMGDIVSEPDPRDFPVIVVGPFGNTVAPSMMAALVAARLREARPKAELPETQDSDAIVWFTELKDAPIRAHVGEMARLKDIIVDKSLRHCKAVVLDPVGGKVSQMDLAHVHIARGASGTVDVTLRQPDPA